MFSIDSRSRMAIYEQLVQNIIGLIARGVLQPDDQLPSCLLYTSIWLYRVLSRTGNRGALHSGGPCLSELARAGLRLPHAAAGERRGSQRPDAGVLRGAGGADAQRTGKGCFRLKEMCI